MEINVMDELKAFDNVISAIDYLYRNLKDNRTLTFDFDLERLRKIGITACDNESNTYLWHINALIHSSIDLNHLILGLEIMFQRYLKFKHKNSDNNQRSQSLTIQNTSINEINEKNDITTNNENKENITNNNNNNNNNLMEVDADESDYFLKLKSRSASRSPKKMLNNKNSTNMIIEPCDDTLTVINDMTQLNMNKIFGNNNNNNNNNFKTGIESDNSMLLGNINSLQVIEGPININDQTEDSTDYIAQLLLTPEHTRLNSPSRVAMTAANVNKSNYLSKDHLFNFKINQINQSSPNATRMKHIKHVRQQERDYQLKMQKTNQIGNPKISSNNNNNIRFTKNKNKSKNKVESAKINQIEHNINDRNEKNANDSQSKESSNSIFELSPFEIGKFVRQVDQSQF